MKIGILGGTFDPIHNAHIEIAKQALKQFQLDKVMMMPTPNPPHKDRNKITGNFHRANMIKLAIKNIPGLEFSDFELHQTDVTYTADTLCMLQELHPEDQYYFIVGSDSIASFMSWYRPDVILKYATLLAVRRDDESSRLMDEKIKEIREKFDASVGVIQMEAMAISSSDIRINDYSVIRDMVPEAVYQYIVENQLYLDDNVNTAWSINKITEDLKETLKPQRFEHTVGVANTAKKMAETFGVNPNKAYFAGMLHDCAKNLSDETLFKLCTENDMEITAYERKSPYLLHGKAGALIARNKYGITDQEILSAIIWHTTGKPGMTDLEKIIFSADYIEPGRHKQPNLAFLRDLAEKDLDLLTFHILKDTVEYLKTRNSDDIDNNTINAYAFYKKLMEER